MCGHITGLGSQAGSRSAVLKLNCVQAVPSLIILNSVINGLHEPGSQECWVLMVRGDPGH